MKSVLNLIEILNISWTQAQFDHKAVLFTEGDCTIYTVRVWPITDVLNASAKQGRREFCDEKTSVYGNHSDRGYVQHRF
jgi:hypothetical protein